MAYTDAETVRYFAQVDREQLNFKNETDYDSFINDVLIPKAQALIDHYCNHSFTLRLVDYYLDGSGKSTLWLPPEYCPPVMFGTVTVDGVSVTIADIHLSEQFIQWDGGSFNASSPKGIHLIGSAGFGTIPTDIQMVTDQLCANSLLDMVRRKMAPDLFSEIIRAGPETGGGGRNLLAAPWIFTKDLKQMLEPHRIIWVDIG